ncbi:MAG: chalcone isomerase family protein [Alphaproteobacteria bacterium]
MPERFKYLTYILFALIMCAAPQARAMEHIKQHVPDAQLVGQGRLSFLIWNIYDAQLYAPQGRWEQGKPLALKLSYLRSITGKEITDSSIKEIRNQGINDQQKLDRWYMQMGEIFPDVEKGEVLTGIYTNSGETIFYKDTKEIGRISKPAFGKAFFGIWLGEETSAPRLRRQLLGAP